MVLSDASTAIDDLYLSWIAHTYDSRHLIEQPREGTWSAGPEPLSATCCIALYNSGTASSTNRPGVDSSSRPRYCNSTTERCNQRNPVCKLRHKPWPLPVSCRAETEMDTVFGAQRASCFSNESSGYRTVSLGMMATQNTPSSARATASRTSLCWMAITYGQ